ncbi:MAG: hypothetical protein ABW123_27690 [Cystobacter sp.]
MAALMATLMTGEVQAQDWRQQSPWSYALSESPPMRWNESSRFNMLANRNQGYPRVEGERLVLIPENRPQAAAAVFLNNQPVQPPFAVQFDYTTLNRGGGDIWGTGDGLVLMFGRRPLSRRDVLPVGGGRAFVTDGSGYGVHVALYGEERGLILTDGSGRALASRRNQAAYSGDRWATLRVEVERDGIRVYLDDALQIDWRGQVNASSTGLGIGAGTGDATALHAIRNLRLAREPRSPPRQPPGGPPGPPGQPGPFPPGPSQDGDLLINGGFEQPSLRKGSFQALGDLPGWRRSDGRTIELQNNVAGSAAQGSQLVELDGENNTAIYQDVATRPGTEYELRLAFSARPGTDLRDNALEVSWNGRVLTRLDASGEKLSDTAWTYTTVRVRAEGPSSRLELRDVGRSTGSGTYVDDVSLRQVSGGGPRR